MFPLSVCITFFMSNKKDTIDIILSKNLSRLLRHKAKEENIPISSEGYIKVSDILQHTFLKGKYTVEDIKRVVLTNTKKRFTLTTNNDELEICANQGHSIPDINELNLLPITEPQPYDIIHGTFYKNWMSIKVEGISRQTRNHIHFAKGLPADKSVISGMRSNCQVYIYVNLELAFADGILFYESVNGVILTPGNENGIIKPNIGRSLVNMNHNQNQNSPTSNKGSQVFICDSCNVQFLSPKSFNKHKKTKNHLSNEKAHGSKGNSNSERSGIYVRGYPEKTKENDLIKYFSQFGNVIWAHFGHDFLLLDFTEAAAVERVMTKSAHFFNGRRLFVRHKEVRNTIAPINDEEVNEKIYRSIVTALERLDNFENEFFCMAQQLQPNMAEAFKKYNLICQDLYTFLSQRFPRIQIHPFGSTLTGLGFNNSDIDIFLSNVRQTDEDEITCLNVIKRLLNKSNKFSGCFAIPGAKIPLVKCVHRYTGIKCDLNIKNMLGVCNSKLIHYYLSIDLKVKQAMIVLKYWAKCHKITGQNHLLTNYSLAILFIFFLQQPPYHFPRVLSLQHPEYDEFLNIQECWNGGFVANYNFHCEKLMRISRLELLEQFFSFYANFPYHSEIISPYLGHSVPKNYFKDVAQLPGYFNRYKQHMAIEGNSKYPFKVDSCMCIQDPFEHSRNIAGIIADSVLEKFILMCKLAVKICAEKRQVMFRLLTEEPPNLKKPKYSYKDDHLQISLHRGVNSKYITSAAQTTDNQNIDELWFDVLVNFITIALRDFLQLTLTPQTNDDAISPSKNSKTEGQSDVHDSKSIILTCAGKTNMWNARKATAKQLNLSNLNGTLVERETAVTNHLKEAYKNFQDTTDILRFKITLEDRQDEAVITVDKISAYKKSFKSFATFFAANVPLWFEVYEKDLGKAANELNS